MQQHTRTNQVDAEACDSNGGKMLCFNFGFANQTTETFAQDHQADKHQQDAVGETGNHFIPSISEGVSGKMRVLASCRSRDSTGTNLSFAPQLDMNDPKSPITSALENKQAVLKTFSATYHERAAVEEHVPCASK
jgi:hypothetical protein